VNNAVTLDIQHTLDRWQEQGADRYHPARFTLIQSMMRRAQTMMEGDAKRLLEQRLCTLVQDYEALISTASVPHQAPPAETPLPTASRTALAELLEHLSTRTGADDSTLPRCSASTLREHYPELPILDEFRSTLSRTSAVRQVLQSEAQVHENAGPLNSNHLVHRALAMMRDVSPGYLHQFLSYLDALSWVEQLHLSNEVPTKETKRNATKAVKRAPSRSKKKPADTEPPSTTA
jgi:hypothetical protein